MSCLCAPQCWPKVVITEWCVRVTPCGFRTKVPLIWDAFLCLARVPHNVGDQCSQRKRSLAGVPPGLGHCVMAAHPGLGHRIATNHPHTRARETSTIVSGPFTHTPSSVTTIHPGFGDCVAAAHPSLGHCATTIQQGLGHCVWSVTQASTVVSSPRLRPLRHDHSARP